MTGHGVARRRRDHGRFDLAADIRGVRAARMEAASRGRRQRAGHVAGQAHARPAQLRIWNGDRGQQRLGIGVARRRVERGLVGLLDDLEADCDFSDALLDDLLVPRLSVGVLPCCRDGGAPLVSGLRSMGIETTGSETMAEGNEPRSNRDRGSVVKASKTALSGSRIAAKSTKSSS